MPSLIYYSSINRYINCPRIFAIKTTLEQSHLYIQHFVFVPVSLEDKVLLSGSRKCAFNILINTAKLASKNIAPTDSLINSNYESLFVHVFPTSGI